MKRPFTEMFTGNDAGQSGAGLVPEPDTHDLELCGELPEIKKIKACIFTLPVDEGKQKKIFLACEEIFVNIASYSGADHVRFRYHMDGDHVTVIFTDNGKPFNPLESRNEKEFEDFDEGGMGISLVRELCSHISYSNTDGANVLRLEFADNEKNESI